MESFGVWRLGGLYVGRFVCWEVDLWSADLRICGFAPETQNRKPETGNQKFKTLAVSAYENQYNPGTFWRRPITLLLRKVYLQN